MHSFAFLFPEVASVETRHVTVPQGQPIPAGTYLFREFYCTERGCDCHRVILGVVEVGLRRQVATINHYLRPRDGAGFSEDGTFLDPLNPQSECSVEFLRLFIDLVCDAPYEGRLRRHYRMVKDTIENSAHPVHARLRKSGVSETVIEPIQGERRVGRNERCPCGSGKKAKRCCRGTTAPI